MSDEEYIIDDDGDENEYIDYDPDKKPKKNKSETNLDDLGSDGDYGHLDEGSDDYGALDDGDDYGAYDDDVEMDPEDLLDDAGGGSGSEDGDAELENMFLEAKDQAEETDMSEKATLVPLFEKVVKAEKEKGPWGFRALKWLVRIHFQVGNHEEVKKCFNRMLDNYKDLLVEKEKALKKLLEFIEESPAAPDIFQRTLATLSEGGNKKAALRLELIHARVLAKKGSWDQLDPILERLHDSCRTESGDDDPSKGSQLLEIYSLKIQLQNERENNSLLKELYTKALAINGLANPRVTGVIHECGGKAHMRENKYKEANTDFIEAFKSFDEGGAGKEASACLKYLVLANLLSGSDINPFDDNRAKAYSSSTEIQAMMDLVSAVQAKNLDDFERVLRQHKAAIIGDKFIDGYIQPLRRELRKRVFISLSRPYKNLKLNFIGKKLHMSEEEAEAIIVEMILDGQIDGVIDQVAQIVFLRRVDEQMLHKYRGLHRWASSMRTINEALVSNIN